MRPWRTCLTSRYPAALLQDKEQNAHGPPVRQAMVSLELAEPGRYLRVDGCRLAGRHPRGAPVGQIAQRPLQETRSDFAMTVKCSATFIPAPLQTRCSLGEGNVMDPASLHRLTPTQKRMIAVARTCLNQAPKETLLQRCLGSGALPKPRSHWNYQRLQGRCCRGWTTAILGRTTWE